MQTPLRLVTALLALVLAAGLVACGGDDEEDGGGDTGAATAPAEQETAQPADGPGSAEEIAEAVGDAERPQIPAPSGEPPTELETATVIEGDGEEAQSGDTVTVQYAGVAWSNGQEFDASYERGQPFPFTLGAGEVIPGWDEGVEGMRVGERRVLVIPPDQAYGPEGAPPAIGPDETLVFVVDLVEVG